MAKESAAKPNRGLLDAMDELEERRKKRKDKEVKSADDKLNLDDIWS